MKLFNDVPNQNLVTAIARVKRETFEDQIARNVIDAVLSGMLKEGDLLPPIRVVAKEASISRTPVEVAYRTLKIMGIIGTRRGRTGGYILCDAMEKCKKEVKWTSVDH